MSINVPEVDVLGAPLKVVDKLMGAVVFFKYECIVKQLAELINYVNFRIVSDSAVQLSKFSDFKDKVF